VLDETLTLREYDMKVNNITVEREIDPATPNADADSHQMEQVFLNIINNAVDAMMESGSGGKLRVKAYAKDKFVCVEFRDSGPGIQDPKRIFDPFYTTKSIGKGTGLGLSICYGIVKEHGGDIVAHNHPDGGAVLEVRIPVTGQSKAAAEAEMAVPKREMALEGRVLLAEEEEAVLEFERDVLVGAGAAVVTVLGNKDLKERMLTQSYDAFVVSGGSAGWKAPDIYKWLAEKSPGSEKRVLFTFSTVMDSDVRSFLQEHNIAFLVKPFEVSDLIAATRKLTHKTQVAAAGK
jgi:two-component system, NtrC family, sensor kinase